jgi:hypothetical protein
MLPDEIARSPRPAAGDVLVSNTTATPEHSITIMPGSLHEHCPTRTIAIARASELARKLQVDVWLTEDQTHFLYLASYRARAQTSST